MGDSTEREAGRMLSSRRSGSADSSVKSRYCRVSGAQTAATHKRHERADRRALGVAEAGVQVAVLVLERLDDALADERLDDGLHDALALPRERLPRPLAVRLEGVETLDEPAGAEAEEAQDVGRGLVTPARRQRLVGRGVEEAGEVHARRRERRDELGVLLERAVRLERGTRGLHREHVVVALVCARQGARGGTDAQVTDGSSLAKMRPTPLDSMKP